ncbi:TetR/AcrR family transcriptional regulator [Pseudorhodoferax sp. Leaf267]|uniref:TetR/AcrR family transcriptional regulator n=1 Tax=Pseudorhodoferax sp. Leaf267 TaxID=1736316 RepID=UPI0007001868|nr:TetR/AcrR family transcriptional regulator [Pseudorhodoferax sp. Leaf267]KQP23510.1 TetR family transcriptional regulator [Pseudorhodoferax sp. Leaf267]
MTPPPPSPRRKPPAKARAKPEGQWHHGDLRASLILWGTHLLDTEGIAGMSMRAAAKLAGVSQGAPAHHFQDRNGLLAAIAAQAFRDMGALRHRRLAAIDAGDAQGRLRAVMLAYVEFAQAHPARFHLMFGPQIERRQDYPELVEAGSTSFQLLRSVVAPLAPPGHAQALDEEQLSFAIWAATHGLATLSVHNLRLPLVGTQRPGAQQFADMVVRFCLAALGVPQPADAPPR